MDMEAIRDYCLKKKGVTESFPFDETTLVFKVADKMFALLNLDSESSINLKCDPELAISLREEFSSVLPGYHMNKNHWNTVLLDGSVPVKYIFEWIDMSYNLVKSKLPVRKKTGL